MVTCMEEVQRQPFRQLFEIVRGSFEDSSSVIVHSSPEPVWQPGVRCIPHEHVVEAPRAIALGVDETLELGDVCFHTSGSGREHLAEHVLGEPHAEHGRVAQQRSLAGFESIDLAREDCFDRVG